MSIETISGVWAAVPVKMRALVRWRSPCMKRVYRAKAKVYAERGSTMIAAKNLLEIP